MTGTHESQLVLPRSWSADQAFTMAGSRVGGSTYTPRAKPRKPLPIQSIIVGVCWFGFAIVCLSFLSSSTGDEMKAIVGACFGFATLATCVYFGCHIYTTQQTNSRISVRYPGLRAVCYVCCGSTALHSAGQRIPPVPG